MLFTRNLDVSDFFHYHNWNLRIRISIKKLIAPHGKNKIFFLLNSVIIQRNLIIIIFNYELRTFV